MSEQLEAAFLGQSPALSWLARSPMSPSRPGQRFPPELALALEKLATDASSPLHASARIAEAYVLHDVAGQEDRALDLLRQALKESPSYTARFWLTAFLAQRQQYKEAAQIFDGIRPIPGNFTAFLQGGRRLLEHADKGEPLYRNTDPATAPGSLPTSRKRISTTADLLGELRRLTDDKSNNPSVPPQALALAAKLSNIFPAEATFPGRETVLKAFSRFGGLDRETARIEARARELPRSADAMFALGNARSLSADPKIVATSIPAYREAFRLAPNRVSIAEKIVEPDFLPTERVDAYCVLLRHGAHPDFDTRKSVSTLPRDPAALVRYAKAYGEGFGRIGRKSIGGTLDFRQRVEALRKAGQDDAVIDMLTVMNHTSPPESSYYAEPEQFLIALLGEKGRADENTEVVDRMLFPSEYLYGLDLSNDLPMPLLASPDAYNFLQKVRTPERMATLANHARQIMVEHPGGARAPLVLLMLLAMEHDPALGAELSARMETLRANHGVTTGGDLAALAQLASTARATQPAALELLEDLRRWRAESSTEMTATELLASTALDIGDRERAAEALRDILATARTQKPSASYLARMSGDLVLMARAGMKPEADELSTLIDGLAENFRKTERRPVCSFVFTYIEACVRYGQPEMGRAARADFQRQLAADLAYGNPEKYGYEINRRFLVRWVETFIALDAPDEAAKALQLVGSSRLAAAMPEVRQAVASAQDLLVRGTGGRGALPVAFVGTTNGPETTLWWDVSALNVGDRASFFPWVSLFGADLPALKGRYSVEILGGDTPNHLTRIAVIPQAPSRGAWRGTPATKPVAVRFTRVILTDATGAHMIGPALPAAPGEECIADPDMSESIKSGQDTAQWTLPDGVLSTIPGPVPGRPGLSFAAKGIPTSCAIRGKRIAVRPGESFVQSAWVRSGEEGSWGRRYFDAQGKELTPPNGSSLSLQTSSDAIGWTLVEQRLESVPDKPDSRQVGIDEQIPVGTAFIEPVLRLSFHVISWDAKTPVRWAGLSLRSVPPLAAVPTVPQRVRGDLIVPDRMETPVASVGNNNAHETVFAALASAACKVAVSLESDMVVVGCKDGTLHLLEYPSGKELAAAHPHDDPIIALAVPPGQVGIYSVDKRGDTHFVSGKGAQDKLVAATAHPPTAAVVSPTRKWVIYTSAVSADAHTQAKVRIEVVDLTTGKPIRMLELPGYLDELKLSPDEKQFSIRQEVTHGTYVVHSWELPTFNPLPDRTEQTGRDWVGGTLMHPLFAADPVRKRYVMVENTGRFVVRSMENETLWAFDRAQGATSLAIVPKDGAILLCKPDGKLWRCTPPK